MSVPIRAGTDEARPSSGARSMTQALRQPADSRGPSGRQIPVFEPFHQQARLAQSVEHETLNLRVAGSSPSSGDHLFP